MIYVHDCINHYNIQEMDCIFTSVICVVLVRYVQSVNYLQSNNMQELVFFCNLESYFLGLGLINTPLFNTFVMISCISYDEKVVIMAV